MAVAGKIENASQILTDRAFLNRLGYGIFDLAWGSSGYGFENVRNFSYVIAPDFDPKIYRHKVFEMTGHYFNNSLAREIWYQLLGHKIKMSQEAGQDIALQIAAEDWFTNYSHAYLKEWVFSQPQIPDRFRYREEARKHWSGVLFSHLIPQLKQLLDSGFSLTNILGAALQALKPPGGGVFYVRLVASLLNYSFNSSAGADKAWQEIQRHQLYLTQQMNHDPGFHYATLDYFKRLNLLEAIEQGEEG